MAAASSKWAGWAMWSRTAQPALGVGAAHCAGVSPATSASSARRSAPGSRAGVSGSRARAGGEAEPLAGPPPPPRADGHLDDPPRHRRDAAARDAGTLVAREALDLVEPDLARRRLDPVPPGPRSGER